MSQISHLIPWPKDIKLKKGSLKVEGLTSLFVDNFPNFDIDKINNKLKRVFKKDISTVDKFDDANLLIVHGPLSQQAYQITISEDALMIVAQDDEGVFYALTTVSQMISKGSLPQGEIYDFPDLNIRGLMLDISRGKVAKLKTLQSIVDLMEDLKYNHLQLYVEGFSFEYKSFPEVLTEKNYITLDDYLALEKYCQARFIDFVPNQNGFGHMSAWLARDEYKELAECPDGFFIWGADRVPSTLNPLDPKSQALVKKMYHDMLPHVSSQYFNMNFDEPYELGHGKSKSRTELIGNENVFIEYAEAMAEVVKSYGKKPMMWGDVLIRHPEALAKLSQDIIFIDWGYNLDYPFDQHLKRLKKANIEFMAAAGTSTWSVVTSRYNDMVGSIRNACLYTILNEGLGFLLTDWGDLGHLQYWPFSLPGLIYGAMSAWNFSKNYEYLIIPYLSKIVENEILAQIIIDMSQYTRLEGEYRSYGSRLFSAILWAEHISDDLDKYLEKMATNRLTEDASHALELEFKSLLDRLNNIKDISNQALLIKHELTNALRLLNALLDFNIMLQNNDYLMIDSIKLKLQDFLREHQMLWNKRNLEYGYPESSKRINNLIAVLDKLERRKMKK